MVEDKSRLVNLFETKINLLLEKNEGYSRFKGMNLLKIIKQMLLKKPSKSCIVDLGFLLHLYALQLRLTTYKNLIPFSMFSFKKDLQEIINALHTYSRHRNSQAKPLFDQENTTDVGELIPPRLDWNGLNRLPSDNPELYDEILCMLEEDVRKIDLEIPEDIIKEMQHIDLKKIYDDLPALIEKKKYSTIRKLADEFPVFEDDRLSLVAVFNEVLFLANEGKVCLRQMEEDAGVRMLK